MPRPIIAAAVIACVPVLAGGGALADDRTTPRLAVVSFAATLQEAIVVGLMVMLLPDPQLPAPLEVAVRAGVSGVLGMFLYIAGARWRSGAETRRRNRMSRLRMG